jgi:protein arginine kinase activator
MKCQKCDKPATFHITELTDGTPQELHLCEEHAREYLSQGGEEQNSASAMAAELAGKISLGQTAEDLARLDEEICPVCGISFYEFRSQGRLGCPNDYNAFASQLEPLIFNVHGEDTHHGKIPTHGAQSSQNRVDLIRLRREMEEAVRAEEYEKAGQLRDQISQIEGE